MKFFIALESACDQSMTAEVLRDQFLIIGRDSEENDRNLFRLTVERFADSETDAFKLEKLTDLEACMMPKCSGAFDVIAATMRRLDYLLNSAEVEFYGDLFEDDGNVLHFPLHLN
jgi:hypothetical protein